jgi:hypothetical protein
MKAKARPERPPRPDVDKPCVLVLHEKHGTLHFHIHDEPTLHKVALDVLTKRLRSNDWYYDPAQDPPRGPGLTKEQAEALPEGSVKASALKEVARHAEALKRHRYEVELFEGLKKAVSEKDGKTAWRALRDRSDGEYQRVSLEKYYDEYYEYER